MRYTLLVLLLSPIILNAQSRKEERRAKKEQELYENWAQKLKESNVPTKNNRIYYQEIIPVDSSVSMTTLLNNVDKFLLNYSSDYNSHVHQEINRMKDFYKIDKPSGIANANIKLFTEQGIVDNIIGFDATIECKNGRYRYTFSDFKIMASGAAQLIAGDGNVLAGAPLERFSYKKAFIKHFKENMNGFISSLENTMKNNSTDNW